MEFNLALRDPHGAKAHSLALRLDELALFDDLRSGDYEAKIENGTSF
jgi:hypothetical protein